MKNTNTKLTKTITKIRTGIAHEAQKWGEGENWTEFDGNECQALLALEAGRIADELENIKAILVTGLANGSPLVEALRGKSGHDPEPVWTSRPLGKMSFDEIQNAANRGFGITIERSRELLRAVLLAVSSPELVGELIRRGEDELARDTIRRALAQSLTDAELVNENVRRGWAVTATGGDCEARHDNLENEDSTP